MATEVITGVQIEWPDEERLARLEAGVVQLQQTAIHLNAIVSRMIDLDIPKTAAERDRRLIECWDAWYGTLPDDLKCKLSLHDFKRLGEAFRCAFGVKRRDLQMPGWEHPIVPTGEV